MNQAVAVNSGLLFYACRLIFLVCHNPVTTNQRIMATIRKRSGKYQVQIRALGSTPISKTFSNKSLAEKWARKVQLEIEQGIYKDSRLAQSVTFE